ncbi:MAG: site-2 protease family protein [Candidatus Pacearchaeota archaeon]
MSNIVFYDIGLLILFAAFFATFLYRNRENLKREGLLYLYRTKWGMRLIEKTAKKFPKTLKVTGYAAIVSGYLLMIGMLVMVARIVVIYVFKPALAETVNQAMNNAPPIMPLIPYLPEAFNISFLPPFYFTYWIVILAIVAVTHEFAHGIFMRRYGINIKTTGFGFFPFFLPVFLAAFVEQDEESMQKASKTEQKAVLAAGTFANVITGIIALGLFLLFLSTAFTQAGVTFDNYEFNTVAIGSITAVNNATFEDKTYNNLLDSMKANESNTLKTGNETYLITEKFLERQRARAQSGNISAYYKSPAAKAGIKGHIQSIGGEKIKSRKELSEVLSRYSAGENTTLKTTEGQYEITLQEHPNKQGVWLGIMLTDPRPVIGEHRSTIPGVGEAGVYYKPDSQAAMFIEGLLEWLVLISFTVALVNMLPVGIFDGGRFFYLTIWEITGSEKQGRRWFGYVTYFFLLLLVLIMAGWILNLA